MSFVKTSSCSRLCRLSTTLTRSRQYSFHTNLRGFSCDQVTNYEIVLADGSVVNANPYENADLWKAQKGGSGNFGFVTRIDQRMFQGSRLYIAQH